MGVIAALPWGRALGKTHQAADMHPWSNCPSSSQECQAPSTPCLVQRSSRTPNHPIPSTEQQPTPPPCPFPSAAEGLSPCSWELWQPRCTLAHARHNPGGGTAVLLEVTCGDTQVLWVKCGGTQVVIKLFPVTRGSSLPSVCIKFPQPGAQTYCISNAWLGEDIRASQRSH